MNLIAQKETITTEAKALSKKVEKFRADLLCLIQDLPDNPAIKRQSGNCYTISMKDLTQTFVGRTRDGQEKRVVNNSWAPEMHDFKHQYKRIAVILNKIKFEDICKSLDRIIDEGGHTSEKFHPGVIENIKRIWRPYE